MLELHKGTISMGDHFIRYVDAIISNRNPAILPDSSNIDATPLPIIDPHVCNKPCCEIEDFEADQVNLVATCQYHTHCSAAYSF